MAVYKDPDQPLQVRIDAAKAALPYEKARRVATEPKEPERGPVKITFVLDNPDDDPPEYILANRHAKTHTFKIDDKYIQKLSIFLCETSLQNLCVSPDLRNKLASIRFSPPDAADWHGDARLRPWRCRLLSGGGPESS